jgi:hypothetical protein
MDDFLKNKESSDATRPSGRSQDEMLADLERAQTLLRERQAALLVAIRCDLAQEELEGLRSEVATLGEIVDLLLDQLMRTVGRSGTSAG